MGIFSRVRNINATKIGKFWYVPADNPLYMVDKNGVIVRHLAAERELAGSHGVKPSYHDWKCDEQPSPTGPDVSIDRSGKYKKAVIQTGRGVEFEGYEVGALTELQDAHTAALEELAIHRRAAEFRKHEGADGSLRAALPNETQQQRQLRGQIAQKNKGEQINA